MNKIGFPCDQLESLEFAAALHDVGKIAISKYLINKPTALTEIEVLQMQMHTVRGGKLIQSLLPDPLILDVVLYHHENYDGSGYPAGLRGENIPLAARIVRITDSYGTMTSARPYRSPYSREQAIELLREDCRYFDRVLLKEFLTMIVPGRFQHKPGTTTGALSYILAEQ